MLQNKKKPENLEELKSILLKELHMTFDIFLEEQFEKKLEKFIIKKIEDSINNKFDEVFQENFNKRITIFLEENFNYHDLSILNKSLERRLKEIKENNETS